MWEGKANVIGVADKLEVVAAVAESAAFLLFKDHPVTEMTDETTTSTTTATSSSTTITATTQSIATRWLDALEVYVSTSATGLAARTHQRLGMNMAR